MFLKKVFFFIFILSFPLFAQITNNKEIFTKQEKQWIKKNPTVSISMLNNFVPFSFVSKNTHKGLSLDVVKRIEEISGLDFEIKSSRWSKALKNFKENKTDIISDISYTKKRSEFALFTSAYYEIPIFIFGLKSDENFKDSSSLRNKTVAVSRGIFYIDQLKNLGINVLEVDSSFEKAQAVIIGKADYFLASYTTGQKSIIDNTFYTLKVHDEFSGIKKEDLRFAVKKDKPLLKSIIDKSLKLINENEIALLSNKWIINNQLDNKIAFSKEELEYIEKNPVLTYSEIDWKPLSIIENGRMKGIMGDYMDIISDKTGLKFKYISSNSWPHVLKQFEEGKIDIVPGVGSSNKERKLGLLSEKYASFPLVMVTSNKYTYIENLSDLKDPIIVVPKYYTSYNFIKKNYPNIKLITTKDIPEALLAVENGRADVFVGHIATSLHYISELHLNNLKISGTTDFQFEHSYLIQKNSPVLLSIINKAITSISVEERKKINAKWMHTTVVKHTIDYEFIFLGIFIFIIVVSVFIYRQNLLRNYNNRLKDSFNDIQSVLDSIMEAIIITENRKCIEVNNSAVKLFGYSAKEEMIGQDILNFISKDSRELVKNKILSTVNNPYEFNILTSKNNSIKALGKGVNLKLSGKNVRISSIIDISDIKNKEKLLIEQSKMAALGEMIGHIAHQWRQPLSIITTIATSWQIYDELDTFDKKKVIDESKVIHSNAKYLSQTIDDFRLFIKNENSDIEFSVKALIDNLIRLEVSSLQNERIELILDNELETVLLGNQNKILQALINIVNNAIDALKRCDEEVKLLFISVKKNDENINIEFIDNAGGIDESLIDKIFEPYFTTKHQFEGTGLGLYMTYTILNKSQASISVENNEFNYNSKSYKGAKFIISLPTV